MRCAGQARPRLQLVFDADGLAIDEKVDFGRLSPTSLMYRLLKWYERAAIAAASSVIGRTAAACEIYERYDLKPEAGKYLVALNGRDPEHFKPLTPADHKAARIALDIDPTVPLIVYSGSFGEKYCPSMLFRFFRGILQQRPDAKFLIMTGSPEAAIDYIKDNELDIRVSVRVGTTTPQMMPPNLAAADLGLCFYQNTFSNRAFQATKLGEYLLCGLAVAGTTNALPFGLGDTSVCRSVGLMSDDEIDAVASWFVCDVLAHREAIRSEARRLGKAHLSVDAAVSSYARAIQRAVLNCGDDRNDKP